MKYAILSDIHGNFEALQKALDKIDELGAEKILNLGDLVGYYTEPNECVDLIRDRRAISIMGNHDVVACGRIEPIYFNPAAAQAILWARDQLTPENREYLAELPDQRKIDENLMMVHGSVRDRDEYLLFRPEIELSFAALQNNFPGVKVVFFGHTHRRIHYEKEKDELFAGTSGDALSLREGSVYLINPGSVGQPRDRNSLTSCAIYESEKNKVSFFRMKYDIKKAQDKIRKAGLPPSLAERLSLGV